MQWHSHGGQLLHTALAGQALFYVSPLGQVDRPHRGGVPVLFPQFAEYGAGPKHGLVRSMVWQPLPDGAGQWCEVRPDPERAWNGHAICRIEVEQSARRVVLTWTVQNLGDQPFDFGGGLHPYFAVSDVRNVRVLGLESVEFVDRYARQHVLGGAVQNFDDQPFERLYVSTPELTLQDGTRRLRLSCVGFDEWMIWNPAVSLSGDLADLPDDDWVKFLCIEPVIARCPRRLAANAHHVARLMIELE